MTTETVDQRFSNLDCLATTELVSSLVENQLAASATLHTLTTSLTPCVDAAAERLGTANSKGRLVFVGAGTSGRIAVQDGAELWPTFGWPDTRLLLKIAGGSRALIQAIEGAEDDTAAASDEVLAASINEQDVVIGLAASGRTPWTCAWISQSRKRGALTIALANNPDTPLLNSAEFAIALASGAEVLAGSTRLAAGTTQKIALNVFSTALMVRLNRTYGNLMVDMAASNAKLQARRVNMLQQIVPGLSSSDAQRVLQGANGHVKLAVLLAHGKTLKEATTLLADTAGSLREALRRL